MIAVKHFVRSASSWNDGIDKYVSSTFLAMIIPLMLSSSAPRIGQPLSFLYLSPSDRLGTPSQKSSRRWIGDNLIGRRFLPCPRLSLASLLLGLELLVDFAAFEDRPKCSSYECDKRSEFLK